ncbi:MAG: WD40 repeat domain-containing protein [Gammaproteobacteria bacterium]|nr:WD40 repeat domain-containing protein [Gammaproteobacteria bacterium]
MKTASTLKPFAKGDIFAGATLLNVKEDDHAGDGRIIQYDSNLNEKGVLWTAGTTHLIGGLSFAPDGTLWAFDSNSFCVIRVSPEGRQLPKVKFADRAFSNITFAKDGTIYLGEHLVGNTVRTRPGTSLGTTLPKVPGTDLFGYGHLYQFTQEGRQLREFATPVHGGMPAFLGLTGSALRPDGKTMLYLSELSDSVRVYDLVNDKPLPNLVTYAPDSGNMAMTITYLRDGRLMHIRANFKAGFFLEQLSETGEVLRSYPLPGPGWAAVGLSTEKDTVLIGNFFTGTLAKFSLDSGQILAKAESGVQRSLAGLAQYPG